MPHMLRIAVESVHDDDGRGVSASRSASQRIVPTASLPPSLPSSSRYLSRQRSFAPDASSFSPVGRTCCSYRSFGHRPFGDCMHVRDGGEDGEDRVDASINVYASCRSITFVIGTLWRSASCRAAHRVRMHLDLNRRDPNEAL